MPFKVEYYRTLFVDGLAYLSPPSVMNDPWEAKPKGRLRIDTPKDKARFRRRALRKSKAAGLPAKEASQNVLKALENPAGFEEGMADAIEEHTHRIHLCCFTANENNLLMWSHYCAGHSGVVVRFNASLYPVCTAQKVAYRDTYPVVEYPLDPSGRDILDCFLTKADYWEYEHEYRLWHYTNQEEKPPWYVDPNHLALPRGAMTSVTLGVGLGEERTKQIIDLIHNGPFEPEIWQAVRDRTAYRLGFEQVE